MENERIVYTEGTILQARIELEAMLVANVERNLRGESPAYDEKKIRDLIEIHGIHHNALMTKLFGASSLPAGLK